jgi:hypothetical protein
MNGGRAYETGRVGSTDTRATVADGLVGDRELAEVETDHLGLDLDSVCRGQVEIRQLRARGKGDGEAGRRQDALKTLPL